MKLGEPTYNLKNILEYLIWDKSYDSLSVKTSGKYRVEVWGIISERLSRISIDEIR